MSDQLASPSVSDGPEAELASNQVRPENINSSGSQLRFYYFFLGQDQSDRGTIAEYLHVQMLGDKREIQKTSVLGDVEQKSRRYFCVTHAI